MKKLLAIIVLGLLWCNVANAEQCISIEKICLGDSALDHFSEKTLNETEYYYFEDKNFVTSIISDHPEFKVFKTVEIDYKKSDKKHKILYVNGRIFIEDIEKCLTKLEEYNSLISGLYTKKGKFEETKISLEI